MRILLVIYDDESYIHTLPLGLAYITAALKKAGYDVTIYNQDVHHYPEAHLTSYLDKNHFDVVGVSVVGGYYQYAKLLKISKAINNSKNRPSYYVLGGHGPSPEPEYFIRKTCADAIIIGEGEATILEFLQAVSNKKDICTVKGIAFRKDNEVIINPRRELVKDIDTIYRPAYESFPMEYYRLLRKPRASKTDFTISILTGRGCTFKCNFCYRMDQGYRSRSAEAIVDEIKFLQKDYGITYIDFIDELLMVSKQRVLELCSAFEKANLNFKWSCNGRLNYATSEVLLRMQKTGCVYINYGIEAFDNIALKNMKKNLTTEQITKGIEETLKTGMSPGFNIIFGNIGETKETLQKGVDFLLKYDDCSELRTIRPVTPYPGSPLYYHAIERGLLKDIADFYENKHLNSDLLAVNFTDMSDKDFHKALLEANLALIKNYLSKKTSQMINTTNNLYLKKNVNFRGYRQT